MPIHLILAYTLFITLPLGLALSIGIRRRKMQKKLKRWTSNSEDGKKE